MIEELRKLFAPNPDTPDMSGFRFADLFDNERWRTTDRPSYGSKRDETIEFREYVPRPSDVASFAAELSLPRVPGNPTFNVPANNSGANRRHFERNQGTTVKTVTSPDGGVTTTETTKFLPYERLADTRDAGLTPSRFMPSTFAEEGPGMASYAPPTMRDRFAEEGPGLGSYAPVTTTGNPFGYPMRTAIQGPPRYTDVNREMQGATPMMPISNYRRSPYGYTPMEMPAAPPISGIGTTHGRLPVGGSRITPSVPSGLHPGWETGYGMASPQYGYTTTGAITPFEPAPQSMLDRFPFLGMDAMSDADRMRMLERLLIGRDD